MKFLRSFTILIICLSLILCVFIPAEAAEITLTTFEIEPVTMIKGIDETHYYSGDELKSRYIYSDRLDYTVITQNDRLYRSDDEGIIEIGGELLEPEFSDDQLNNPWTVGKHTVKAKLLNMETEFVVEIIENPVESVEFDVINLTEYVEGEWYSFADFYDYDDDNDEALPFTDWFRYYTPLNFTVTLNNGEKLRSANNSVDIYGTPRRAYIYGDQDPFSPWTVGDNTLLVEFLNESYEVTAHIEKSTVKSVEIKPLTLAAETDGYYYFDDDYTRCLDAPTIGDGELSDFVEFSVTMEDGTVFESKNGVVMYNDKPYSLHCVHNTDYGNYQWKTGSYKLDAYAFGVKTEMEIEVVPNPIKRVDIPEISLDAYKGGGYQYEYNKDGDYLKWYRYSFKPDDFSVVLKDGNILKSSGGAIEYMGIPYKLSFTDPQSVETYWFEGKHKVKAEVMGFNTSFTVNIKEEPYTVLKAKIHRKTRIILPKTKASLYIGKSMNADARVWYAKGKVRYYSSDKSVAKVNSNGRITALKKGKATITVKNGSVSKKLRLTVKNPTLNKKTKKLKAGKSFKLKIKGGSGGARYLSSSLYVASVSGSGVVRANHKGKAVVSVYVSGIRLQCKITVK